MIEVAGQWQDNFISFFAKGIYDGTKGLVTARGDQDILAVDTSLITFADVGGKRLHTGRAVSGLRLCRVLRHRGGAVSVKATSKETGSNCRR